MNRSFELFNFRAKAVLCVTLALAMHVVVGCGGASAHLPAGGGSIVPLTPDHALTQALAGTPFSGATAIQMNPSTMQFRLIFPDNSQLISGTMTYENGTPQVKTLTMAQGSKSVTLSFNANQEITNIDTSAGPSWQRTVTTQAPRAAQAPRAPGAKADNIQSYLSANADLMQLAEQMDTQGVTSIADQVPNQTPDQTVKAEAAFWPLAAVFGAIVLIPLGIAATLYFIFEIVVVINAIF